MSTMPILKTEILGSVVEINYEEVEKDQLLLIIENFKKRLENFKDLQDKVSDKKILLLAALKAEDQIMNNDSVSNIIKLNDKINSINSENYEIKKMKLVAIE